MAWEKNSSLIFKKTVSSRRKTCPLRCIKLGNKDYKFQNVISKKKKKSNNRIWYSMWKLLCRLNLHTDFHFKKYTHTTLKLLIQWRCSPKELFFDSVFSWAWKGNFPPWLEAWGGAKVNTHVNTKQLGKIHSESVGSHEQAGIY